MSNIQFHIMEKSNNIKEKVVVIVGPTASGKTSLSIQIAKNFNGEIISADSRQVYRGLDLGTGKVTEEEMQGIPHHLLDVADPMDTYNSADFVIAGREAVSKIVSRSKLPIVAGGSFFYIDNLLGKINTPEVPPNPELRAKLEKMDNEALFGALEKSDPRRASEIDRHNKVRLVRALEIVASLGAVPEQSSEPIYDALTIGIKINKDELHKNIHTRITNRLDEGMIEEVEKLHDDGMTYERMEELGLEYRYIAKYLQKQITKEKMIEEIDAKTRQFAKRQMSWLKRDRDIQWFDLGDTEDVFPSVDTFLNK